LPWHHPGQRDMVRGQPLKQRRHLGLPFRQRGAGRAPEEAPQLTAVMPDGYRLPEPYPPFPGAAAQPR
jgi:hypothetical protein